MHLREHHVATVAATRDNYHQSLRRLRQEFHQDRGPDTKLGQCVFARSCAHYRAQVFSCAHPAFALQDGGRRGRYRQFASSLRCPSQAISRTMRHDTPACLHATGLHGIRKIIGACVASGRRAARRPSDSVRRATSTTGSPLPVGWGRQWPERELIGCMPNMRGYMSIPQHRDTSMHRPHTHV